MLIVLFSGRKSTKTTVRNSILQSVRFDPDKSKDRRESAYILPFGLKNRARVPKREVYIAYWINFLHFLKRNADFALDFIQLPLV